MSNKILFCTVGGNHKPIVESIKFHKPDFVVFICSKDDPTTRKKGSYVEVQGKGRVCKSNHPEPADLPNIPTQVGLEAEQFEVIQVPADEPETIIEIVRERLHKASSERDIKIIADYTGGTKSMTGGLLMAAIQTDGVELSLVSGPRTNLHKVEDGWQQVRIISTSKLRSSMKLDEAKNAWKRHAYSEAAQILERANHNVPDTQRARMLSQGFTAWDRFDYARAFELLKPMSAHLPGIMISALGSLKLDEAALLEDVKYTVFKKEGLDLDEALAKKDPLIKKSHAYKLWDLYLAADRRARSGQFDTAILLLYRACEGIAQWTLRFDHHIDAGNVPAAIQEQFPKYVGQKHDGRFYMGYHNAWHVIGELEGPLSGVGRGTEKTRLNLSTMRNKSLLAHGFDPIQADDYQLGLEFFDQQIKPAFLKVAFKGKPPFGQLPTAL